MPAKKSISLSDLHKLPKLDADLDIREIINTVLDDKKLIGMTKKVMTEKTHVLSFIKELSELVALRLNLPTKDDVANVAKLSIQVEEKIDSLEEKFAMLADRLEDMPEAANHAGDSDTETDTSDISENVNPGGTISNESFDLPKRTAHIDPLKQFQMDLILKSANLHEDDLSNLAESLLKRLNKIE